MPDQIAGLIILKFANCLSQNSPAVETIDQTTAIILGVAGILLLLLIGGIFFKRFGKRKKPKSVSTNMYVRPAPPQNEPVGVQDDGWFNRLQENSPFPVVVPYAQFNTKALIIGIGSAGYRVLEDIAQHVVDTNTKTALFTNSNTSQEANLALLHIHVPLQTSVSPLPINPYIRTVEIDATQSIQRLVSRDDASKSSSWEWAVLTNHVEDVNESGRHTARIALYRYCQYGPSESQLYSELKQYSGKFNTIYLVGSATEKTGANLFGDIAGMLRMEESASDLTEIHAVVLTEAFNQDHVEKNNYLVATLYELGKYTCAGRVSFNYGPGMRYVGSQYTTLLNTVMLFTGENALGLQRAANFLWGVLTNLELKNLVNKTISHVQTSEELASRRVPAVSLVFSHAVRVPLHFLRTILTAKLLSQVLESPSGPSHAVLRDPHDEQSIEAALTQSRYDGLLAQIRMLRQGFGTVDTAYLKAIETELREMQKRHDDAANQAYQKLRVFSQNALAYDVPFTQRSWLQAVCAPGDYVEVLNRIGWQSNPSLKERQAGGLIRLIYTDNSKPFSVEYANISEITIKYGNNILRFVSDSVENAHIRRNARINIDPEQEIQLKKRWVETPKKWTAEYREWLFTADLNSGMYDYGLPSSWQRDTRCKTIEDNGTDNTFALQCLILPHVPLNIFRLIDDQYIDIKDYIIGSTEAIGLDIFGQKDLPSIPSSLLYALSNRVPMWHFFECWRVGSRSVFEKQFRLGTNAEHTSWEDLLWGFIIRFEEDKTFRDEVHKYLEATPEPETSPEFIPDSHTDTASKFSAWLKRAFESLKNSAELATYPPEL